MVKELPEVCCYTNSLTQTHFSQLLFSMGTMFKKTGASIRREGQWREQSYFPGVLCNHTSKFIQPINLIHSLRTTMDLQICAYRYTDLLKQIRISFSPAAHIYSRNGLLRELDVHRGLRSKSRC